MAATKICPACKKEIANSAVRCLACQRQLTGPCWEIIQDDEGRTVYFGKGLEKAIEKQLLEGKVKLSDDCRQYIRTLKNINDGKEEYEITNETAWAPLKTYTDKVPELQVLYSPVKALSSLCAGAASEVFMVLCVIGFVVAGIVMFWPYSLGLQDFSLRGFLFRTLFFIGEIVAAGIAGGYIGKGLGPTLGSAIGTVIGATIGLTVKKKLSVSK